MKKYSSAKGLMIFIGMIVVFLFLPSLSIKQNTCYAQVGVGASCNAGGYPGVCHTRPSYSCPTYFDSGNYCPGAANVQCCVNSTVSCGTPWGSGTCRNNYMACNGTYHSGYCPGPSDVQCCVPNPPTPTPVPATPTPATCVNDPDLTGTNRIISTGVAVSASGVYNNDTATYGPQNIVDGVLDRNKIWDAGGFPTQWVEFDLGAPQAVAGMKLYVNQSPNGGTTHQIYGGPNPNPTTLLRTISCGTNDGDVLTVDFTNAKNIRYIRVTTTASPSWVAWSEITIFGTSPGSETKTPGIIFSGDGSASFGQGHASTTNWVVGGLSSYSEVFNTVTNKSFTNYQNILDRVQTGQIPITDISTICTLTNCSLPANLPNGVYQAKGNLNLNGYTFPDNKNYVFLINGDFTILGNIVVPNGSTAFFTSSNDITVDTNVGTATNLFPLPAGQLDGIYSADANFRINGINNCTVAKDKMLNVEGAIVTNAVGNGGTFRIQRDLCGDNLRYPAFTIRARLDMLLNMPEVLMQQSTTLKEDAP